MRILPTDARLESSRVHGEGRGARRSQPRLFSGCSGTVEDSGGGANVHVEGGAVVGVPGHAGYVGGVELPGEQRRSTEHMPQRVPGPLAAAAGVTPAGS